MNELTHKCKNKIYHMFKTHTILKLALLIFAICIVSVCLKRIPSFQIKYAGPPGENLQGLKESQGDILLDEEETLVAESDTKLLYIDPATLNIKVEDKATKTTWNAIHTEGTEEEKSLIKIKYVGEDNTFIDWNSYDYSVKNKTYTINRIANGVRINLEMKELDSNRINEYMPLKITISKYETTFLKGLDDKVTEGVLTAEEAEKYKVTLSLIYAKDEEKDCYYNRYSTAPPMSAVNQLIEVTKILNYTTEQLMEDNGDFGITVDIVEPAVFIIPIEAVLEGDDFLIHIPTNEIVNGNKYFTLTRMQVLPYFGSVAPKEVAEGHILVPDGAGALINLNEFNSNYGSYNRALYDNTYYNDLYYLTSYPETLHMPVFGMTYGKGKDSTGGFLGIIEQGDETAEITANLASAKENGGGGNYNIVYSSLNTTKYAQVSILGPYDDSGGRFMSSTGPMEIDYKLRYKLYSDTVTYYDMAKTYQNYLIDKYDLSLQYDEQAKLYLDVVGSLSLDERILGIPYNKIHSMTTYEELIEIMKDLGDTPLVVNYMGMFNGGLRHKLMNGAHLTRANGTKKQLEELISYGKEKGQEIFFQTDFSKIYESGNGFLVRTHGIYNFDNYPIEVYGYNYATGTLSGISDSYNLLSPVYLSSVVNGFLKEGKGYENLTIGDLASTYYANYRKDHILTPSQSQAIIDENLKKLADTKTLALNNPEMNKIIYGKYATNISRESSGYGGIAEEIPFRQLVMNGLTRYTTLNVNESGVSSDYFLLQALELGSYPKYVITADNMDVLKKSTYTDFISRQYSLLKDDIKALYLRYEEAFDKIQSMEISDHNIIMDCVYETVYANGVKVITNYNKYPVVIEDKEIGALGYLIIQ